MEHGGDCCSVQEERPSILPVYIALCVNKHMHHLFENERVLHCLKGNSGESAHTHTLVCEPDVEPCAEPQAALLFVLVGCHSCSWWQTRAGSQCIPHIITYGLNAGK